MIADETPMSTNRIGISIISHNNDNGLSDFLSASKEFVLTPILAGKFAIIGFAIVIIKILKKLHTT